MLTRIMKNLNKSQQPTMPSVISNLTGKPLFFVGYLYYEKYTS